MHLLALAVVLAGTTLVSACGSDDSPSRAELNAARKEGAQQARQQQRIRELERDIKEEQKDDSEDQSNQGSTSDHGPDDDSGGSSSFSGTDCGSGVVAGPNTTCPFALAVAAEFHASGGAPQIDAYSPVTGQTYTMTCTPGQPNICRGGNDASVAFP